MGSNRLERKEETKSQKNRKGPKEARQQSLNTNKKTKEKDAATFGAGNVGEVSAKKVTKARTTETRNFARGEGSALAPTCRTGGKGKKCAMLLPNNIGISQKVSEGRGNPLQGGKNSRARG